MKYGEEFCFKNRLDETFNVSYNQIRNNAFKDDPTMASVIEI